MTKTLIIILLTIFASTNKLFGQNNGTGYELSNGWTYVIIKDTETLQLIDYNKAYIACGYLIDNSLAICVDKNGDTLRVIEFCPGPQTYKSGQLFTFTTYKYVSEDKKTYQKYIPPDEKIAKYKYNSVRRTTFGDLKAKSK